MEKLARRQARLDRRTRAARRSPSKAPARRGRAAPQYTTVFGEALVRGVPARRARRRHHRRDELRHRPRTSSRRSCPSATTTSASPSSTRCCSRPGSRSQGAKPVAAIYSTFLQRGLRPDRPRRLPPEAERGVRDGPRRPGRRRRAHPPRRLRHLLPALPAAHRADGAARRGDARAHAAHRADATTTARSRCATRAARARACRIPTRPEPIEIGRGEVLREGERVALLGYGYGVPLALGRRRPARGRPRRRRRPSPTPASPSRSTTELIAQLVADHDVLVTIEENVLAGGFGVGGGRAPGSTPTCRDARAAALRAAGPLRHPRQAGAPARGGRAHARGDRRAGRRTVLEPRDVLLGA